MSNIIFRKISSTEPVQRYLSDVISGKLLAGKRVLWLLPGGSAMKVAVAVSRKLPKDQLHNVTVTLTDERYGPEGHRDSNWPQLEETGLKLDGAILQPVLKDKSLEQTVKEYAQMLKEDFKEADYSLALAGMGPDGHICGIKPGSPAVETNELTVGYKWDDFTRITTTGNTLKKLDEVIVYTVGEEKWPQLDALDEDLEPRVQPAQLLKSLRKVIIYNDYKGDQV